jgi:hypothetical protein
MTFILYLGIRLGMLQFGDNTIEVTRITEANTKLFTLLYSTKDGESLDTLIGKAVAEGKEDEELKNFIKIEIEKMESEVKISNYRFYIAYDNKKYFELEGSSIIPTKQPFTPPSTILIPVPYNSQALMAQASLIEW